MEVDMKKVFNILLGEAELFEHDLTPAEFEYFQKHLDAFKTMWKEMTVENKKGFIAEFYAYSEVYGYIREFPTKMEIKNEIFNESKDFLIKNFAMEKVSAAKKVVFDIAVISENRERLSNQVFGTALKRKDPFYNIDTRSTFRKFFGEPTEKHTYKKTLMTMGLYAKFGGAVCRLLRRWVQGDAMSFPSPKSATLTTGSSDNSAGNAAGTASNGNKQGSKESSKKNKASGEKDKINEDPHAVPLSHQLFMATAVMQGWVPDFLGCEAHDDNDEDDDLCNVGCKEERKVTSSEEKQATRGSGDSEECTRHEKISSFTIHKDTASHCITVSGLISGGSSGAGNGEPSGKDSKGRGPEAESQAKPVAGKCHHCRCCVTEKEQSFIAVRSVKSKTGNLFTETNTRHSKGVLSPVRVFMFILFIHRRLLIRDGSVSDQVCAPHCQTPLDGNEKNLCQYTNTKTWAVLRKNVTTTTEYHTKSCNLPSNPSLQCPETRINTRVYWYPVEKKKSFNVVKCCPGWDNYVINVGCTRRVGCGISLPQVDSSTCKMIRMKHLLYYRSFYKLTTPIKRDDPKRTELDVIFPSLNQSTDAVIKRSMMDPFTAHWFNIYFHGMLLRNNATAAVAVKTFSGLKFDNYGDFIQVANYFKQSQEATKLPYFRVPSMRPGFRSILENETWTADKYFVEQRLAGLNPMSLRKVTFDGKIGMKWDSLYAKLNKTFNWNKALSEALGTEETIESAITKGTLFAVDYPMYDDIPHVRDITDPDFNDTRVMMKSTSPIGIFAVGKNAKGENELRVAAIQLDYKPNSEVRTPKDGHKWMVAKATFQIADFAVVEIYEHLLRTHVRIEPFCVCIHRHIPPTHPLNPIFKIHCRGLLPTNSYGFPKLTSEMMYMHKLFGMGHVGTLKLLNDGYEKMKWKDNDLLVNIKARGLDDKEILPYFPYRDDGKEIYKVIDSFSKDFVNLYYDSNQKIIEDYEIQNFVNELSAEGSGTNDAGRGMVNGLPSKLQTREELADILKEVIWLVVQHASVNYPITAYGIFPPNMPTKLYEDPENRYDNYLAMLPKGYLPMLQTFVTMNLGIIRYDVMFDYSKTLQDVKAKNLVLDYYNKMMTEVQPVIEARNKKRFTDGHLTYPYLEPKWLPNSIHT
eukprot:gene9589-10576_t